MEKTLHRVIINTSRELGRNPYVLGRINGLIVASILNNDDNANYMLAASSVANIAAEDDEYIFEVRCSETAFENIKSILDGIYHNMCTYE